MAQGNLHRAKNYQAENAWNQAGTAVKNES